MTNDDELGPFLGTLLVLAGSEHADRRRRRGQALLWRTAAHNQFVDIREAGRIFLRRMGSIRVFARLLSPLHILSFYHHMNDHSVLLKSQARFSISELIGRSVNPTATMT